MPIKPFPKPVSPVYNFSRYQSEMRQILILKDILTKDANKVLDLCCGSGQYRQYFSGKQYIGIDLCNNGFSRKTDSRCSYVLSDAQNIPIRDGIIDFVFCSAGVEHVKNDRKAIEEMGRVMSKNAMAYIAVPSDFSRIYEIPRILVNFFAKKPHFGHGYHYYSRKKIKAILKIHHFDIVHLGPETGFTAMCCLTLQKWSGTIHSVMNGFFVHQSSKSKQAKSGKTARHCNGNSIDPHTDPRSDLGYKQDFSQNRRDPEKRSGIRNKLTEMIIRTTFFLDYYFPIPIFAAWIIVVKKSRTAPV